MINLRGFVLDNSCDFEVRVQEVLNIAWQKFDDKEKAILEEAINKTISTNTKRYEKNKGKILARTPTFPNAVNAKYFLSHSDRLYLFSKVIDVLQKNYGFNPEPKHLNFKSNYEEDISHYRNALGHRKSGEKTIEVCGQSIEINEALHKKLRSNITSYNNLIEEIESFISQEI